MHFNNEINSMDIELNLKNSQHNARADSFKIKSGQEVCCRAKSGKKKLTNKLSNATKHKTIPPTFFGQEANSSLKNNRTKVALCRSQEELRLLSIQLLNIQENERQRIAADLHDGIGQSLSLILLSLDSVTQRINSGDFPQSLEVLQQLNRKVKETISELHRTTMDMRPPMLDDLGIIPTLSWFFREFELIWEGRKIEKMISVEENEVPSYLKTTIFRILQESMNNIVKHACADLVRFGLKKSDGLLQLSIEDNGRGFDLEKVSLCCSSGSCDLACGFGLMTMKERARSTNGIYEMKSNLEQGTKIVISWPLVNLVNGTLN